MSRPSWIFFAACIIVCLLGLDQAWRSDEVWSLQAVALPWTGMMDLLREDIHPPLFYVVLRAWTAVAGTSEVGARLLTLAFHIAAAGVVWHIFADRGDRERGVLAAIVLLTSPLGIVTAQLLRMYSLLEVAAALVLLYWMRWTGGSRTRGTLLGLALATAAGSFVHVWFFCFLLGLALAHIVCYGFRGVRGAAASVAAGLVPYALIWLPVLLRQAGRASDNLAWLHPPEWSALAEAALMQAGMAVFIVAVAAWRWRRTTRDVAVWLFPALTWLLTLAVPFAVSFVKPLFWARFTVVALPAFALACAGLSAEVLPLRRTQAALLTLAVVFTLGRVLTRQDTCDSRWTAQWLSRNTSDGDTVVYTNLSRLPVDWYWDRLQPRRAVRETSLPRTTDSHPGFEGRVDASALYAEANAIGQEAASRDGRLILLHGYVPETRQPLVAELDRTLNRTVQTMQCPASPNYFSQISIWARR